MLRFAVHVLPASSLRRIVTFLRSRPVPDGGGVFAPVFSRLSGLLKSNTGLSPGIASRLPMQIGSSSASSNLALLHFVAPSALVATSRRLFFDSLRVFIITVPSGNSATHDSLGFTNSAVLAIATSPPFQVLPASSL